MRAWLAVCASVWACPSSPTQRVPSLLSARLLTLTILIHNTAGVWHAVDCVGGGDSVSINISIDGLTYADHIAGALRQALMAHAPFTALVQTGGPPQASVQRMGGLLREAARALEGLAAAPEALLPPCVLWGQPLPPLEPAEGEGREEEEQLEEEEVDEEGSEAGSDGGDVSGEEEEEEEEDLGQSFPHPVAPTAVLRRSPLAALFALDDTVPDDDDDDKEAEEDDATRGGTEAFMVHFAFGAGEELASVLRKKVVLQSALGLAVARQPVGAPFAPGAVDVEGGGTLEGRRALGALVHLGVLVVEGEEAGKGPGGQQPARKRGRK